MVSMRKALLATLLVVTACGGAAAPTTTVLEAAPSTEPAPVTTAASQEFAVQNCDSPPITFSALCQAYELIQAWHFDQPVPPEDLAGVALRELRSYSGTETEEPPRTLICAVPDEAFHDLCEQLALMVQDSQIAVGPAVDAAVVAMAQRALDPFTYYVPPDQVGAFRSNGVVGGLGLLLDATDAVGSKCAVITDSCPLQVIFVLENNPGADAGLAAGDVIIAVDGTSVDGQGFTSTAATIAGDETGVVEIQVDRQGETVDFTITRSALTVPTVEVELPRSDVGYIRIPDFEDDIPDLVRQALESLAEFSPRTIVVDLRDNPGGLIQSAVDVASEFISDGLVLETVSAEERLEYPASAGGLATGASLVVLVNRGTASAAEILAGALRDRRGAVIVGASTFGKDTVQIPFELRNGGELYVAVARWLTPNGLTVGNGGLSPDRELEMTPDMTIEEVVGAALEAAS